MLTPVTAGVNPPTLRLAVEAPATVLPPEQKREKSTAEPRWFAVNHPVDDDGNVDPDDETEFEYVGLVLSEIDAKGEELSLADNDSKEEADVLGEVFIDAVDAGELDAKVEVDCLGEKEIELDDAEEDDLNGDPEGKLDADNDRIVEPDWLTLTDPLLVIKLVEVGEIDDDEETELEPDNDDSNDVDELAEGEKLPESDAVDVCDTATTVPVGKIEYDGDPVVDAVIDVECVTRLEDEILGDVLLVSDIKEVADGLVVTVARIDRDGDRERADV